MASIDYFTISFVCFRQTKAGMCGLKAANLLQKEIKFPSKLLSSSAESITKLEQLLNSMTKNIWMAWIKRLTNGEGLGVGLEDGDEEHGNEKASQKGGATELPRFDEAQALVWFHT